MKPITLTPALAYASGRDAGNASMRAASRTKWNEDDAAQAARVTNRLLYHLEPPEIQAAMIRDGLVKPQDVGK